MNDEKFEYMIRSVADHELSEPINANENHPVDDVNLLESWALGDLLESRKAEIVAHLADCVYCRREVSAMVHDGVLVFSKPVKKSGQKNGDLPKPYRKRIKKIDRVFMAVAVLFLIAVGIWFLRSPEGEQIARIPSVPTPSQELPSFRMALLTDYGVHRGASQPDEPKLRTAEEIIEKSGSDPEKRFESGLELLSCKKFGEATDFFEKMDKDYPENAAILNAWGVARYWKGETEAAEKLFECAKKLDPDNPRIQQNLDEML